MFDLTSSKLLILAIVAVIVVGPKDLPVLLRTVGKYLAVMRRHAAEFRARFDEVLREVELHDLKKEIEDVGHEMRSTIDQGGAAIDEHVSVRRSRASPHRGSSKPASV
jgi:sec-independent protein translocase protein TatB